MQHRSPNPSAVRRRTPWSIPLLAVTVGAGLVALAGCAGSGTTDDPAITPRPAAHSAAPSTSASATPTDSRPSTGAASAGDDSAGDNAASGGRCDVDQLAGATTKNVHTDVDIDIPITLTNTGNTTCTVQGWPGVSFVTGATGKQVGRAGVLDRSTPHPTVTLDPGGEASFVVHVIRPDDYSNAVCAPRLTDGLRVIPPGSTKSLFVEAPGYDACSSDLPSEIHIGAVVPGAAQ